MSAAAQSLANPNQIFFRPTAQYDRSHGALAVKEIGTDLTLGVLRVLNAMFVKRNSDGSHFTFRITSAITYQKYGWHVVTVDTEALHHFTIEELLSKRVTDALAGTFHRPVVALQVPGAYNDLGSTLVYVVFLRGLPPKATVQSERLPATAALDVSMITPGSLQVPIGMTAKGAAWSPLSKLGHTLIVGASGTGKSQWIHAALAAILKTNSPSDVRVALIDPKRSELAPWAHVAHLFGTVAHTAQDAAQLLETVVDEMDQRGARFSESLCLDITSYNSAHEANRLPYIVIVVDECLDLVLGDDAKSFVRYLRQIAIRGRSAGIVLFLSTQHAAAVDGLDRVVTLNLSTRIVFRVNDASAARSAGCPGAESISRSTPGRFIAKLESGSMTVQGFMLTLDELRAVSKSISVNVTQIGAGSPPRLELTEQEIDLSERELCIARSVLVNNNEFNVATIARAMKTTRENMNPIAIEWESRGWLMPVRHTNKGSRARQATQQLIDLVERSNGNET